jgi:predicted Zn-dependent protease
MFWQELVDILLMQNKVAEAEQYIAKVKDAGAMNRHLYIRFGHYLEVATQYKRAAEFYETALRMEPKGHDYYSLGRIYLLDNNKDKAFAALNHAVDYGYNSKKQYETDGALNVLKSDERWKTLLTKLK